MSKCPFCGSRIGIESGKCSKCGASLSKGSPGGAYQCSRCGGALEGTENNCPFCGFPCSVVGPKEQEGTSIPSILPEKTGTLQKVTITPDISSDDAEIVNWKWRHFVFTAALNTCWKVHVCPRCGNDLERDPNKPLTGFCEKCGTNVKLAEASIVERPMFPIVPILTVRNKSGKKVNMHVEAYVEPDLTDRWKRTYDIESGKEANIYDEIDPKFRAEKFRNMPSRGNLHLDIMFDNRVVFNDTRGIKILPYNQMVWVDESGQHYYPYLRCFVTPNDPAVAEVVSKAKLYLQELTGRADFVGYQLGQRNVMPQVQALYRTLKEDFHLSYKNMPPSFDTVGESQTILLPREVLSEKAGNCIELATLFCSCVERVGVDPVIFIIEGHAFPGFFTQEEVWRDPMWYGHRDFPAMALSDSFVQIYELIKSELLVAFEAAGISGMSFEEAFKDVHDHGKLEAKFFRYAINLRPLREWGFTPLAL